MDQAQQLRNIIKRQQIQNKNATVITITSGKGGVGKSTSSVNLAIALSKLGKKVIILDADFGLANVEVMLGIRPRYSLVDLMVYGKQIREIITEGPEGVGFISGGSGIKELSNLSSFQIKNFIERLWELDELADYIIIDTGAGVSDSVMQFVFSSSKTILITTPEPTSITDSYALLKGIHQNKMENGSEPKIFMITNRVENREEGERLFSRLKMVAEKYLSIDLNYLGPVVQDKVVLKSVYQQKPVVLAYPNSPSAKQYRELALQLTDTAIDQTENPSGIRQLFSNLLRGKQAR